MALLFNVKSGTSCTVSILDPIWLVTSHSCINAISPDPLEWVLFGGPSGNKADNATQIRIVRDIVSHPRAHQAQHLVSHDLALVRLFEPLVFSSEVNAVCLASSQISSRQLCVSAGWASAGAGVSFNQYLTYLPEPVVPPGLCNSTRLYNGHLEEEMVCAKANGDSPICHEDMGAPLMCLEGTTWQLQGVLSKRGGCRGNGPRPAVLTSISKLKGWILDTIGEMRKYSITF